MTKKERINPLNARMHIAKFRDYLRALDAKAQDVTHAEIATAIFKVIDEYPDTKGIDKVRDTLKAAEALRDRLYRFIPV